MQDGRDLELERMQAAVAASDEDVASKAGISSKTVVRAKKRMVPPETREAIVEALEALRVERNARTSQPFKKVRTG